MKTACTSGRPQQLLCHGIKWIGAASLVDSGTYVVQGFTGECEIENDTMKWSFIPPCPRLVSPETLKPVRA